MKKFFVPAAIAALMGAGAWFGHAAATPSDGLSDLQLVNAEALANPEAYVEYDKECEDGGGIFCAISAFQWYRDATPYPKD